MPTEPGRNLGLAVSASPPRLPRKRPSQQSLEAPPKTIPRHESPAREKGESMPAVSTSGTHKGRFTIFDSSVPPPQGCTMPGTTATYHAPSLSAAANAMPLSQPSLGVGYAAPGTVRSQSASGHCASPGPAAERRTQEHQANPSVERTAQEHADLPAPSPATRLTTSKEFKGHWQPLGNSGAEAVYVEGSAGGARGVVTGLKRHYRKGRFQVVEMQQLKHPSTVVQRLLRQHAHHAQHAQHAQQLPQQQQLPSSQLQQQAQQQQPLVHQSQGQPQGLRDQQGQQQTHDVPRAQGTGMSCHRMPSLLRECSKSMSGQHATSTTTPAQARKAAAPPKATDLSPALALVSPPSSLEPLPTTAAPSSPPMMSPSPIVGTPPGKPDFDLSIPTQQVMALTLSPPARSITPPPTEAGAAVAAAPTTPSPRAPRLHSNAANQQARSSWPSSQSSLQSNAASSLPASATAKVSEVLAAAAAAVGPPARPTRRKVKLSGARGDCGKPSVTRIGRFTVTAE